MSNINEFDNEITSLYKVAAERNIPTYFLVPRKTPGGIVEFINAEDIINNVMREYLLADNTLDMELFLDKITDLQLGIKLDVLEKLILKMMFTAKFDQEQVLREINNFWSISRDQDNYVKYQNYAEMVEVYNKWVQGIETDMQNEKQRLNEIIQLQLRLIPFKGDFILSPFNITSSTLAFTPYYLTDFGKQFPTVEDGFDIFNDITLSRYVPYVKYIDRFGKEYLKVYTGEKLVDKPNYNYLEIEDMKANAIYLKVWTAEDSKDLSEATKESLITVTYNCENNYCSIMSKIETDFRRGTIKDESLAVSRTQDALGKLQLGEGKEVKVHGDFDIYGINYDELIFVYQIIADKLFNIYLYLEEKGQAYAVKKYFEIHYRTMLYDLEEIKVVTQNANYTNKAAVSFIVNNEIVQKEKNTYIIDNEGKIIPYIFGPQTPYIRVNILQGESRKSINEFIKIFRSLLANHRDAVIGKQLHVNDQTTPPSYEYEELPPDRTLKYYMGFNGINVDQFNALEMQEGINEPTAERKTTRGRAGGKIEALRKIAPEMFTGGYARHICQAPKQPIIIQPHEIQNWSNYMVIKDGKTYQRPIIGLPRENPKYWFTCDTNEYPFVAPKISTLNEKEGIDAEYITKNPLVPCCFAKINRYNEYISGKGTKEKTAAQGTSEMKTFKVLAPTVSGAVPKKLGKVLLKYKPAMGDIKRYGTTSLNPNSLLHAVCIAIDDPEYARLTDKTSYIYQLRKKMAASVHPSVVKQELYDFADEDISMMMGDSSIFLDPSIFYRAVEEMFNINIYTFVHDDKKDSTSIDIEIPRHRIFSAKQKRLYRKTVLILKNHGTESDNLPYAHNELIVDFDFETGQHIKIYGPEMTEIVHNMFVRKHESVTWNITPGSTDVTGYSNIYNFDYLNIFRYPPISQSIDKNGKLRLLNLNIGQYGVMSIITLPTQPENLPSVPSTESSITRVTKEIATAILGNPVSFSVNNQGVIDGLWYQIDDVPNALYVPIKETALTADIQNIPRGKSNPLSLQGENITNRYVKLNQDLNIIQQTIRWLYEIYKKMINKGPKAFFDTYFVVNTTPIKDSSTFYQLSGIPHKFPLVNTVEEALFKMYNLAPSLFQISAEGNIIRINLYDQKFAKGILSYIYDYDNLRSGYLGDPPKYIQNYYKFSSSFKQEPNVRVFIGKEYEEWRKSYTRLEEYDKFYQIYTTIVTTIPQHSDLLANSKLNPDPYLYKTDRGKIYIIQNVKSGSLSQVFTVGRIWIEQKVNTGYESVTSDSAVPYKIYGVDNRGHIALAEDRTGGTNPFVSVLFYGPPSHVVSNIKGVYAAMLEIL